jgi:hypothetical protein
MRDSLIAAYSEPAVIGVTAWDFYKIVFTTQYMAMYDDDWNIKPNGKAWEDLVCKTWKTDETGKTGKSGEYKTRAYTGYYEVTVKTPDGRWGKMTFPLDKDGNSVSIKL